MGEELTSEERRSLESARDAQKRQLKILVALTITGSIACLALISWRFGLGVLVGGTVSVANYYWMKFTLRKLFENASQRRPGQAILAIRFIGRYLALGAIVLIVFLTGWLPVIAVLMGISGFALAVMIDGIVSIFRPVEQSVESSEGS